MDVLRDLSRLVADALPRKRPVRPGLARLPLFPRRAQHPERKTAAGAPCAAKQKRRAEARLTARSRRPDAVLVLHISTARDGEGLNHDEDIEATFAGGAGERLLRRFSRKGDRACLISLK